MNIVREQMFVNIITKNNNLIETENIVSNCSKLVFHLKYNKCLSKCGNDYIISKIPLELLYLKKFIRKITYFTEEKILVFCPVNQDLDNVIIYK